jgi:hypothetical protein
MVVGLWYQALNIAKNRISNAQFVHFITILNALLEQKADLALKNQNTIIF